MRKGIGLFTILASVFALCACQKTDVLLERFQGQWVDLNSDTEMEVQGNRMTLTSSQTSRTYRVKAYENNGKAVLSNTMGGGFDTMSEVTETKAGYFTAYEQVLDADGHVYEFVSKEVKEESLKIQNLSVDLPKTITSDTITEFALSFTNDGNYGLDDSWPQCQYTWEIYRNEDDSWQCRYDEMYDSYMGRRYNGEVDEAFMRNLTKTVQDTDILSHNGYYMKNDVRRDGYFLRITYESGEEVEIRAEGEAADTCVFDLGALLQNILPLLDEE